MIEFTVTDESNGRSINGSCADLTSLRDALFAYQAHTEAGDLKVVDRRTGRPLARLHFEWQAGADLVGLSAENIEAAAADDQSR